MRIGTTLASFILILLSICCLANAASAGLVTAFSELRRQVVVDAEDTEDIKDKTTSCACECSGPLEGISVEEETPAPECFQVQQPESVSFAHQWRLGCLCDEYTFRLKRPPKIS